MFGIRQFAVHLIGVAAEGLAHAASGLIMLKVERAAAAAFLEQVPSAHESVLEYGQLVGIVANVIEQPEQEAIGNLTAGNLNRADDGFLALVAVQARDEEFALVDGVGQTRELAAFAQEIRAHGDDDVQRQVGLCAGLEQEIDEEGGLFIGGVVTAAEAEDFLKLIHDQQKVGPLGQFALAHSLDEPKAASGEGGADLRSDVLLVRIVQVGLNDGGGQVGERIATRAHDSGFPTGSGTGHGAA